MTAAELYDTDFAEWSRRNAELLRSGRIAEADLEHIAEEIEDTGKRERRSLYNRCARLIEHLLQWQYRPERRGASWTRTIILQRRAIRRLLGENPSLRPGFAEVAAEAYDDAAAVVAVVIKVPRETFPAELPFTDEKLLDEEFWPSK